MLAFHGPDIPKRRDIKGMTAFLTGIDLKRRVQGTFKSAIYGIFTVEGLPFRSPTGGNIILGGLFLEAKLKPTADVQILDYAGDDPRQEATVLVDSHQIADGSADLLGTVQKLEHGDLIRADFELRPYGIFQITGTAIKATTDPRMAGSFMLGSWIVSSNECPAPRLRRLQILDRSVISHGPVPQPITSWQFYDEGTAPAV